MRLGFFFDNCRFFARLSDRFERWLLGLTLVREELDSRKPLLPPRVN